MEDRIENDALGSCRVPGDVYWGIHTQRALGNFVLTSRRVPVSLVHAFGLVKNACCLANTELGFLEGKRGGAISRACTDVANGCLDNQFPLDALQGGAGTSTNMNINEVVANRAIELMGGRRGDYGLVSPLNHVNLHQSTNDTYPTAVKVAAIAELRRLSDALAGLQGAFQKKEKAFANIAKIGRTELVDAVPITLGKEFSAFADAFARDRWRTFKCEERIRTVNLGGTAVGTGLTAPRSYFFLVTDILRELTGFGLNGGENVVDQTANADAFVEVSGILKACAATMIKVANDLRLLQFKQEITLPAVQAGSSVMPGKVNPVILESAIQAGMLVKASDSIVTDCAASGSLQINEFMPLLAHALLESITTLRNAAASLAGHVAGINANADICQQGLHASITSITAFLPLLGYERASELVKEFESRQGGDDFFTFLCEKLGTDTVTEMLTPENLVSLGYRPHAENT